MTTAEYDYFVGDGETGLYDGVDVTWRCSACQARYTVRWWNDDDDEGHLDSFDCLRCGSAVDFPAIGRAARAAYAEYCATARERCGEP